jgi:hypothetical protein
MYWRMSLIRSLVVLVGLVLAVAPVHSQKVTEGELKFLERGKATRELRNQFFKGEVSAESSNATHQEAAEVAGKEAVYYLFWKQDDGLRTPGKEFPQEREARLSRLNTIVDTFDGKLVQMTRISTRTAAMQQMFCKNVISCVVEVAQEDTARIITGVNAARMLALMVERRGQRGILETEKEWFTAVAPRLAEGNGDRLIEACLTLLEGPKSKVLADQERWNGIRYYVLRCLGSLFALPRQTPLWKKENEEKAITVAIKLVEKQKVFPKATPRQEVEGYKALRAQAVRVVAGARVPEQSDKSRPALVLARVAGADNSLVPNPPRLEERLEAAIGLCHMAPAAVKSADFQLDAAVVQIARFVHQFGLESDANNEAKPMSRLRPWKAQAARMNDALDVFKAVAKDPNVQEVIRQVQPVLANIEGTKLSGAGNLGDWMKGSALTSKAVFKDDPASVIKPGQAEEVKKDE